MRLVIAARARVSVLLTASNHRLTFSTSGCDGLPPEWMVNDGRMKSMS